MKKLVACVFGLLLIGISSDPPEAAAFKRFVGLTVTGQTGCWDANGNSIPCAGTGQDGEYQEGWTLPVTYPRFRDNADGTVQDNLTGLIWLKDANCFGTQDWTTALSSANGLAHGSCGLTDGSVAGDWRLPNLRELQSLIDYQNSFPALPTGHPFGVPSSHYWSSTTDVSYPYVAWIVYLASGAVGYEGKAGYNIYVWPVRGGQ